MHSAAAARHFPIVTILLAHGASPNVNQQGGWTPLHSAAQHGDRAMAELLLKHGADRNATSDDGTTARRLPQKAATRSSLRCLADSSTLSFGEAAIFPIVIQRNAANVFPLSFRGAQRRGICCLARHGTLCQQFLQRLLAVGKGLFHLAADQELIGPSAQPAETNFVGNYIPYRRAGDAVADFRR